MKEIKSWMRKNKKQIIIFLSGSFTALCIIGIMITINTMNKKEQQIMELEKRVESKEKEEQKEKQELERKEENQSEISNVTPDAKPMKTEEDVIEYFYEQERYASSDEQDSTIRDKLKTGVTSIYQFLFQGGTIYGKTFQELSSSAKLKVLKIALSIDQKIDSYFPNYKDKIKEGASNLKAKIVITYLETTNKICFNQENICNQAREDFQTMKESFKISFSLISGLLKEKGSALKEWYISTKA